MEFESVGSYQKPIGPPLDELVKYTEELKEQWETEAFCLDSPPPAPTEEVRGKGQRIVFVTPSLLPAGAETHTVTLACELQLRGFRCRVVNLRPGLGTHRPYLMALEQHRVPYAEYMSKKPFSADILARTILGKDRGQADVVAFWEVETLLPLLNEGIKLPGAIFIQHSSSRWAMESVAGLQGKIAGAVGVCGQATANLESMGLPARTIWNGLRHYGQPRGHDRTAATRPMTLGYVGRYAPEKNLYGILAALAMLPDEVRLRMFGWGGNKFQLFQAIEDAGLTDRVDLGGVVWYSKTGSAAL
jgi:glycosyltransferase involved in cell wall biosynthesis